MCKKAALITVPGITGVIYIETVIYVCDISANYTITLT